MFSSDDEIAMNAFTVPLIVDPEHTRFFVNLQVLDSEMWFLSLAEEPMLLVCEGQRVLISPGLERVSIKLKRLPDRPRYIYDVITTEGETRFRGSFVNPRASASDDLPFAFVSCNDNPGTGRLKWNKCHHGYAGGWEQLQLAAPALIVHMDDSIYADQVWHDFAAGRIMLEAVAVRLALLYQHTYSSVEQGHAMRNAHNVMLNGTSTDARSQGMESAYVQVAQRVRAMFTVVPAAPYTLCGVTVITCDTRAGLRAHGEPFPNRLRILTQAAIASPSTDRGPVLVCLPQPLINTSAWHARLMAYHSLGHSDGHDESLHPINVRGTQAFRRMLAACARQRHADNGIFVVSGGLHAGRLQDHHVKGTTWTEMVTSPITRVPRKNEPRKNRIMAWLQDHLHCLYFTHGVSNARGRVHANNFGLFYPVTKRMKIVEVKAGAL